MIMKIYDELPAVIDLSSGQWTSLRELASKMSSVFPCAFTFAESIKASMSDLLEPRHSRLYEVWTPKLSLDDGLQQIWDELRSVMYKDREEL